MNGSKIQLDLVQENHTNFIENNYKPNSELKGAVDEMNLIIDFVAKKRKDDSDKTSAPQAKKPLSPVIYLKILSKEEVKTIVDGLKTKERKLREQNRK